MSSRSRPCFPAIGEAIAKLTQHDLEKILAATLTGMIGRGIPRRSEEMAREAAKHPRWNRPYTELVYQPMLEVLQYLRANGYKTYIVTGGGQDFVRVYAERVTASLPSKSSARPAEQSTATTRTASRF